MISDTPTPVLFEGDVPEIYCSFTIYKRHPKASPADCTRLYIDITQDVIHKGVAYIEALDVVYKTSIYDRRIEEQCVLDVLITSYLEKQLLTRDFDEYYH